MTSRDEIKKQIREWIKLGFINPKDLPSIELYMDQVTTFMNKRLSANKRTEDDKTLTKTMINNYTKNELLPPSNKKRYSKDHLVLLIYIYYLKSVMPISDIQTMLAPMIDNFYDNENATHSLEEIYANLYELEKYQYFNVEDSIVNAQQLAQKDNFSKDNEYLQQFNFLAFLAYDIFTKRKLMEKIIDEMRTKQEAEEEAAKKVAKKSPKKQSQKATKTTATKTTKASGKTSGNPTVKPTTKGTTKTTPKQVAKGTSKTASASKASTKSDSKPNIK